MTVHLVFDLLAAALGMLATLAVYRWRLGGTADAALERAGAGYALALVAGAALGGYAAGTLNLMLSGVPGFGRSVLGALAGAILAVELYKRARGIRGSTGVVFVAGFATSIAVGRIGCYLSGLGDNTHGLPTTLPWGQDFGDGVARHPVQLYKSAAMALFLALALTGFARRAPAFMANGFYLCVGFYAAQRFLWEFLKPYATIAGPLNLFHLIALCLMGYAAVMIARSRHAAA